MNSGTDKQRKVLGKGLSALLPGRPSRHAPRSTGARDAAAHPTTFRSIRIHPNPMQPRTVFQPDRLEELAASIRANGIIQPLIVRSIRRRVIRSSLGSAAGELQSWRASRKCRSWFRMSPIRRMLELALIENIQREDLNPIETAHAYERLSRELGFPRKRSAAAPERTERQSPTSPAPETPQASPAPRGGTSLSHGTCQGDSRPARRHDCRSKSRKKRRRKDFRFGKWRRWFRN